MKKLQQGRSMIEMLGVLAIIGVLSIGGLAGYTMAMNRHRANVVADYVSRCVVIAQTSGDGMTVKTGLCEKITGETAPSAILGTNGDAEVKIATGDKNNIEVTAEVAPAVGTILAERESGHISVTNTNGSVTFTFKDAANGMKSKAVESTDDTTEEG